MATDLRRITISLPPELDPLIKELADIQGTSQSRVVTELLKPAVPYLQRTIAFIKASQEAKRDLPEQFLNTLKSSEQRLASAMDDELASLESVTSGDVEGSSEGGAPARGEGAQEDRSKGAGTPLVFRLANAGHDNWPDICEALSDGLFCGRLLREGYTAAEMTELKDHAVAMSERAEY